LNPQCFFGNNSLWIRSQAMIGVVFEADYEIKLLVITSGKMEITRTFKNFYLVIVFFYINLRKPTSHNVFRTFE